jgi:hypothetical protein
MTGDAATYGICLQCFCARTSALITSPDGTSAYYLVCSEDRSHSQESRLA